MLFFEIQEIVRDLSMMKKSNKLTKRTTKTEKFEKKIEMSASGNIIHSIFY